MKNLQIQCNVIDAAYKNKVKKLLFLGSSCIYPKECPQPIKEEYLLSDYLEKTNEAYALAKIAGLKMCSYYNKQYKTDYISVMPCNLYGINDNFSLENSHVLPALIRKFHEAKIKGEATVTIWGSGKPLREFLNVDDLADACLFLMDHYEGNCLSFCPHPPQRRTHALRRPQPPHRARSAQTPLPHATAPVVLRLFYGCLTVKTVEQP